MVSNRPTAVAWYRLRPTCNTQCTVSGVVEWVHKVVIYH